jgi:hypothetical protein
MVPSYSLIVRYRTPSQEIDSQVGRRRDNSLYNRPLFIPLPEGNMEAAIQTTRRSIPVLGKQS